MRLCRGLRRSARQWRRHALRGRPRYPDHWPAPADSRHGRHLEDLQAVVRTSCLEKGTATAVPFFRPRALADRCLSAVEGVADDTSCNVAMTPNLSVSLSE